MTRLLAVYDGANNLIMRFQYADARMPVSMTKEGVTYYLTYDQVGSLRVVADSAGNVVKRIDYDSFGNIINDSNQAFNIPFGFAGGLHDRDTGLVRFGFRDYDPDIGRWTAKDPIGFNGGDTDLYGYCLNNPINHIDPEGESLLVGGLIVGGLAALAVVGYSAYKIYQYAQHVNDAAMVAQLASKLQEESMIAYNEGKFKKALDLEQARFEAIQMTCQELFEVIETVPPGTSKSGPLPTSLSDMAINDVYNLYMDYYHNNKNNLKK